MFSPGKSIDHKEITFLFSTSKAEYGNKNNYQEQQPGGNLCLFCLCSGSWTIRHVRIHEKLISVTFNPFWWRNQVHESCERQAGVAVPSAALTSRHTAHHPRVIYSPTTQPARGIHHQRTCGSASTSGTARNTSKPPEAPQMVLSTLVPDGAERRPRGGGPSAQARDGAAAAPAAAQPARAPKHQPPAAAGALGTSRVLRTRR